jgi:hypothetical protein
VRDRKEIKFAERKAENERREGANTSTNEFRNEVRGSAVLTFV